MKNQTIQESRQFWLDTMLKIAAPVLEHLAEGSLKDSLPIPFHQDRVAFAPLEAFGRTLCGIAPWLELEGLTGEEADLQRRFQELTLKCLDMAVDPASPDYMAFSVTGQTLVDAAFLSHGLLRAPSQLVKRLSNSTRENLVATLKMTRLTRPGCSNWLFFSAMVETALRLLGCEDFDRMRIDYAVRMFENWYKGDGFYGDGPAFHFDYYNSFVIHPMYLDIISFHQDIAGDYPAIREKVILRAKRYGEILERLIGPDGSYPVVGRSITYRFGAFQLLSQLALEHLLDRDKLPPAQVRSALTAVIQRVMKGTGMFDEVGWLRPGVAGYQPELAEGYINTGSLYLCCAVFLALGLPPEDEFWSGADMDWSGKRVWAGETIPIDHYIL